MDIKHCPKCKEDLLIERFNLRASGNYYSWCKSCTSGASVGKYNYNPSDQQRRRRARPFRTIAHSCKSRRPLDCDVTEELLLELWDKQDGKCYWFGVPMSTEIGKRRHDQVSVDRLNSSKGYSKDNVVLSCWFANRGRSDGDAEEFRLWVKSLKEQLVQDAQKKEETPQETT